MKATKKMFGALALSAALAMGTVVPAFAEAPEVGAGNDAIGKSTAAGQAGGTATGDTVVNINGYDASQQIVATIPVDVTLAVPTTGNGGKGGGELVTPSAAAYKITNKSTFPIEVVSSKVTPGSADWTVNATSLGTWNSPTAGIYLAVSDESTDTYGNPTAPKPLSGASGAAAALGYKIAAKGASDPDYPSLGLKLSGEAMPATSGTSTLQSFTTATDVKAATISYTIAQTTI